MTTSVETIREAVAVFHTTESLEAAIDELEEHSFDRAAISLLAKDKAVREKLGAHYSSVEALEDDPDAPRAAYVSRESLGAAEGALAGGLLYLIALPAAGAVLASGGALGAALLAAGLAGGTGAGVGALLARFVGKSHADYLDQQIDKGGLLLWVRTFSENDEKRAAEILARYAGEDVHIHALPIAPSERIPHEGAVIDRYPGDVFEAQGRLFHSLDAAKAYIERTRGAA